MSKMNKLPKINVMETFAGIGSQHKALERLKLRKEIKNYEVVYTSEWYTDAIIAYDAIHNGVINENYTDDKPTNIEEIKEYLSSFNFSKDSKKTLNSLAGLNEEYLRKLYIAHRRNKNLGDISKISSSQIKKKIHLLTYSFPCQDLSIAGRGMGMNEGSETRSSLLWHIKRILSELHIDNNLPKVLVMENVKAIKSPKHKENLEKFKESLSKFGYKSQEYMGKATMHGIPQERERFFLISILNPNKDVVLDFTEMHRSSLPSFNEFIEFNNMKLSSRHDLYKANIQNKINALKIENPLKIKFNNLNVYPSFAQANIVTGIDKPTISTITFSGENSRLRVLGIENGELTIKQLGGKENIKLMGFDINDYNKILTAGLTDEKIAGFAGNSIVVNVLEDIFLKIFKEVDYD